MSDFYITVGKRIRELRENQKYTREKLAELAEINDKFLYEVETGRKGVSAQNLFRLSSSLGVTMDYLVSGEPANEEYMVVTSLLSDFDKKDIEHIKAIIRSVIAISKAYPNK